MKDIFAGLRLSVAFISLSLSLSQAMNSCFKTDNYNAVRGQPFILTWPDDDVVYDLGFATADKKLLDYIQRNITATSLAWVPPFNITDGPFRAALYNLDRQSVCYTQEFNVSGDTAGRESDIASDQITTTVTINMLISTVTATVAHFTPHAEALLGQAPATLTATATEVKASSASRTRSTLDATQVNDASDSGNGSDDHGLEIGIGVAFGVLGLAVIVLAALLWRSRRRRQGTKREDAKSVRTEVSTPTSPFSELHDNVSRSEVGTSANAHQIDGIEKAAELPGARATSPVELPAEDVSPEWQRAIRTCRDLKE